MKFLSRRRVTSARQPNIITRFENMFGQPSKPFPRGMSPSRKPSCFEKPSSAVVVFEPAPVPGTAARVSTAFQHREQNLLYAFPLKKIVSGRSCLIQDYVKKKKHPQVILFIKKKEARLSKERRVLYSVNESICTD